MEKQRLIDNTPTLWGYKITIEPMTSIFFVAATISQNLELNLMLLKACSVYNVENDYCEDETDSQLLISQINTWKLFFLTVFTVIFTSNVGPTIDRNPKITRYILMIPIFGQLLCDLLNLLSVHFWSWHPAFTALYDTIFVGLSGSMMGFSVVAASYISYTSSKKERTLRIGLYVFCNTLGLGIGYLGGGYATQYLGYSRGFLFCICLHVIALIVGMTSTHDIELLPEKLDQHLTVFGKIKQNFRILTKERENRKQLLIVLCVCIHPLITGYIAGEISVLYLFLRRQFNWDAVEYGVYMSFKMILKCLGALIGTEILKRRLKLHDATIGIIGCSLQLVMSILWMLVCYSWQVYAVTLMGTFERAIGAVLMSLASKCVEPYEYGRLFSLFGFTYIVTPVVYPLYNMVYEIGIYTFPSLFFLVTISLATPCVFVFCILRHFSEKIREKECSYKEINSESGTSSYN